MCSLNNLELCEFFTETWRTARKVHKCSCCRGAIMPGARYLVHFSVFDDYPHSAKMCDTCAKARKAFAEAHGDDYMPNPDGFMELLQECVGDGDEESKTKWERMLEELQARGRAPV